MANDILNGCKCFVVVVIIRSFYTWKESEKISLCIIIDLIVWFSRWAGDVYANPLLLLPGVAGHFNLLRLYDRTWKTIRSHDPQALIFYEPVTWGVLLNENYFGSGFLRPPGNDKHKTVFTWHYYCWLLQFSKNPLINDTFTRFDKVNYTHKIIIILIASQN